MVQSKPQSIGMYSRHAGISVFCHIDYDYVLVLVKSPNTWPTSIWGGAAGKSKKLPCPGVKFLKMIPCPRVKFS